MNTKIIMVASAVALAALGALFTFLPHEAQAYLGTKSTGATAVLIQLLGGLYLGFAMMNWMSKGAIIGGIYARPLALGNFLHFLVGAMALIKAVPQGQGQIVGILLLVLYAVFALLFGIICFRHPLKTSNAV